MHPNLNMKVIIDFPLFSLIFCVGFLTTHSIGFHVCAKADIAAKREWTKEKSGRPNGRIIDTCAQSR